jgi:hypothetical protein
MVCADASAGGDFVFVYGGAIGAGDIVAGRGNVEGDVLSSERIKEEIELDFVRENSKTNR